MRRVVVTGVGLVTPLGYNTEISWKRIIESKSSVKKIKNDLVPLEGCSCKVASYIPSKEEDPLGGLDVAEFLTSKEMRTMDRFMHLALIAANEAIIDSGYVAQNESEEYRTGVLVGSGVGGFISIEQNYKILEEKGMRYVSPFFVTGSLINLGSGLISIKHQCKGPNYAIVSACATGSHTISEGARIIMSDDADVMICGGTEAAICNLGIAGFAAMKALSTKYNDTPELASRPWDKDRDGFVMGEGAGIVVLEELEHAIKRGAKIYGELIGYGLSGDAYHIVAPDKEGKGGFRATDMALKKAQITPEEIDYINAHGTSTPIGDIIELNIVKRLFDGYNINNVAISSTKSSTGHLLGAAGSVEAIFALLAMRDSIIPPTLNLYSPEDICAGINLVPHKAIQKTVNIAMSNSFGFGGTNSSLLFRKL